MSLDLLLLKIAKKDPFFNNQDFKRHFILQLKCLISIEILLKKIKKLITFFISSKEKENTTQTKRIKSNFINYFIFFIF